MTLALHGNIGSAADFVPVAEAGVQLQALDLWPLAHLSLDEVADHLAAIDGPRGICGYSMGGRIALHALTRHPQRWDYAVIISAHPGLASDQERSERAESDEVWAQKVESLPWREFLSAWNAQSVLQGAIPDGQLTLEAEATNVAAAFRNWSLGKQADLRNHLPASDCRISWMVGEQDSKFAHLAHDLSATPVQSLALTVVAGCGHRVLQERPEDVAGAIAAAASC